MVQPQARPGQWFWRVGEQNNGPLSLAQMQAMARAGRFAQGVTVWTEGMMEWVPATRVPVLFAPPAGSVTDDRALNLLLPLGPQSGLAIAAGYCGLIGVVAPVVGAVGLILGLYALRDLARHPDKRGRGRALTGIILGGLGTVLWLLWVVVLLLHR